MASQKFSHYYANNIPAQLFYYLLFDIKSYYINILISGISQSLIYKATRRFYI